MYIKPKNLAPKLISVAGGKGGGIPPEVIQEITDLLLNPSSKLYLPTIVINGFITKLTVDGTIKILKLLFKRFKSAHRRKRLRVMYYAEENLSYFEFPSETTEKDFETGIREIPKAIKSSLKAKYFARSLKSGLWVEEDAD